MTMNDPHVLNNGDQTFYLAQDPDFAGDTGNWKFKYLMVSGAMWSPPYDSREEACMAAGCKARIVFGARDYIELSDPAEIKALQAGCVINLRAPVTIGNHRATDYPAAPWVNRLAVEYFLRGRRQALGMSLDEQQRGLTGA
jgi:hypothetical protein